MKYQNNFINVRCTWSYSGFRKNRNRIEVFAIRYKLTLIKPRTNILVNLIKGFLVTHSTILDNKDFVQRASVECIQKYQIIPSDEYMRTDILIIVRFFFYP